MKRIVLSIVVGAFLMSGCSNEVANDNEVLTNNQPVKTQRVFVDKFIDSAQYHIRDDYEFLYLKIYNYDKDVDGHSQFYLDVDDNIQTGYDVNGIDYLVEDNRLYKYIGNGGSDWNWELVSLVDYSYIGELVNENDLSEKRYKYKFEQGQWVEDGIISPSDIEPRYRTEYVMAKIPKISLPDLSHNIFSTYAVKLDTAWTTYNGTANKKYVFSEDSFMEYDLYHRGEIPLVKVSENYNTIRFTSWKPSAGRDVKHTQYYLDMDNSSETGYAVEVSGISGGYDYLLEDDRVYRYSGGNGNSWSWEEVGAGAYGISTYEYEEFSHSITSSFLKSFIQADFMGIIKIVPMYFDENWSKMNDLPPVEVEFYGEIG